MYPFCTDQKSLDIPRKGSPTPNFGGKTTLQPTRAELPGSSLDLECEMDTLEKARIYLPCWLLRALLV